MLLGVIAAALSLGLVACQAPLQLSSEASTTRASVPVDVTPASRKPLPPEPAALPVQPEQETSATLLLTLEGAINRALTGNRDLASAADVAQSARYSLVAAEAEFELRLFPIAQADVAGGSGVGTLDGFQFGVDLRKKFAHGTEVSVGPSIQRQNDQMQTTVSTTIRQPLLRGTDPGYVRTLVDQAEFSERLARQDLFITEVSTVLTTIRAVYEVIRQREFLRLNEDSVQRLALHVSAAAAKQRAGLATSIDVYRASLQLNQARDATSASQQSYEGALDSLRFVLALPQSQEVEVEAPLDFDILQFEEEEAVATSLAERVELLRATEVVAEARRRSSVARHGTLPQLDLVLGYSRFGVGDTVGASTGFDSDAFSLSVVSSSDIERKSERAFFEQTKLQISIAQRGYDAQRDIIIRQVKQTLRGLRREQKRLELQRTRIAEARGQLEVSRVKFDNGLANNFDVIDAESELRGAETNLASAVIDYIVGTFELRAALGTLIERPAGL